MATAKQREAQEAIERMREWVKPGDVLYTILRHVSRSGMSRSISVLKVDHEDAGRIYDLDYNVARALGARIDRDRGGVKVGGAGMDMGFHLVYSLSRTLFPDGFECVGEGGNYCRVHGRIEPCTSCPTCGNGMLVERRQSCPSNDHSNGDRNYTPHMHGDGGYALVQRWL